MAAERRVAVIRAAILVAVQPAAARVAALAARRAGIVMTVRHACAVCFLHWSMFCVALPAAPAVVRFTMTNGTVMRPIAMTRVTTAVVPMGTG